MTIQNGCFKIYIIRGKQVKLDSDVAMLYHYETKKINQAVKRNIDRFPEKFCFQLTEDEFSHLRSQIVTLNENRINENTEINSLRSQTRIYVYLTFKNSTKCNNKKGITKSK